ncbi:MAG TPA: lamin tail domain-containing protein [Verrucomicrobiae bacterium]|nr:lamin tail domain-containing protein [Verrucomicrobiae bacterium]
MRRLLLALLMVSAVSFSATAAQVSVVPFSSNWRYFIGTNEASTPDNTAWRALGFNDTSWSSGNAPIGYPSSADRVGFEASIATMIPSSTVGNYLSVYFRKTFQLTNIADLTALQLDVYVDDGAAAFINGVEVGRVNLPAGPLAYNCCSSGITAGEEQVLSLTITNFSGLNLAVGQNVLSIHGFNANSTSTDFHVEASLKAFLEIEPPAIATIDPAPGSTNRSLTSIEVFFNEAVKGVDAADLLINGAPAQSIVFGGPEQILFQFPQPATGTVQVAWAPGHGITDLANKPFAGGSWTYVLDPNLPNTGLILNEFMADNRNTLEDEDGDTEDWIEIYNPSGFEVDIGGWFLTDDASQLSKWRFPIGKTVPGNGYLVVFASNKDKTNLTGRLHTNFQIAREGTDYLALVDPTTNVVSEFLPQNQVHPADVSFGRDAVDPSLTAFFATPTPGARNASGGPGFAPEVTFSRPSGTFVVNQPWQLVLSTPDPNATIRYTLGTNIPGPTTLLYSGPITINNSTLIRARAFSSGLLPGPISSRNYIALANTTNMLNFNSHLPIVVIHNLGQGAFSSSDLSDRHVVVQTFEPNLGRNSSMTNAPTLAEFGIAHRRGSSTAGLAKGSLFLEVQDEFREGKNVEFLGLPKESDWILYAPNYFEPVMMKNPLAHQLARDQGEYGPRTRFVEVYLKDDDATAPATLTDADYNGLYVLEEKIKRDKNRVNIAELTPENIAQPEVSGGYIWSIDRVSPGEPQVTAGGQAMNWISPNARVMTNAARVQQRIYVTNYFNQFRAALDDNARWTNPVTGYAAYIDVDSWTRRHIHETLTHNIDGLRLSGYFFKDRNKGIEYGPSWDYDRTMGNGNETGGDYRSFNPRQFRATDGDRGTDYFNPISNGVQWWTRLFNSPDFFQRWIDQYQDLRDGPLSLANISNRIEQFAKEIRPAYGREIAKWPQNVPRLGSQSHEGFTYNFGSTRDFESEVRFLTTWYSNRLDFIDTNFLARPTVSTAAGQVTNGTTITLSPAAKAGSWVYYTLDGTDPRLPSGGILPTASASDVPVTIVVSNNVRLFARSWNPNHRNLTGLYNPPISSPWSGPRDLTYFTQVPPLRITEIMYHPQDALPAYTNDVNFEYLEVKNIGATPLNLNRFTLRGGLDFDFPNVTLGAGQSGVIVANQNEFINRYGSGKLIIGQYAGDFFGDKTNVLDNAGERLILRGAAHEAILDFEYDDDWYPITDGFGFSLVVVNDQAPTANWGLKSHWRPSGAVNGSPAADDGPAPVFPQVVINEVLTHSDPPPPYDSIELLNLSTNDVDISGWFMTDDFDQPRKFRIPDGTLIPAGGFAVFDEQQFNTGARPFSLSSLGEEVFIFSADPFSEELTGYYNGFDFGAAENGRTFGRYITSTGGDQFPPQRTPTLGAPNSGPLIGPIVISEIHYRPPDLRNGDFSFDNDFDEYVELENTGATSVALYDLQHPTNTWRLDDAVRFDFPQGVVIPAGGHLLVVGFNPTNTALASDFRAHNLVPANTPLYGPWDGKLDNSGEPVELKRPDRPEPAGPPNFGLVPYVLVERVRYSDSVPWPEAADGLGPSLQRISGSAYGNDPANWVAAAGSPGATYQGGTVPTITQQPTNTSVLYSYNAALSVQAQGSGLRYQWLFKGSPLPSATNATLAITYAELSAAGEYKVAVLGAGGAVVSSNAILTVVTNSAVILAQPQDGQVVLGRAFTNRVSVSATQPVVYQWFFNGTEISGATSSNYVINPAQLTHAGIYYVRITDAIASIFSRPMTLTVTVPPFYLQTPQSQFVPLGGSVTVSAVVTNTATLPVTYRWRRIGGAQTNIIVFGTTGFFTVTNVTTSNRYDCIVFNAAQAGGIQSPQFFIAPIPDADHDGMSDAFETQYGLDINNAADAATDLDGDGMSNLDEFIAGTDPSDPNSYLFIDLVGANGGPASASLRFMAVSNRTYSVQFRDSLGVGELTTLRDVGMAPTNRVVEVLDSSPSASSRFYQLVTPKQ